MSIKNFIQQNLSDLDSTADKLVFWSPYGDKEIVINIRDNTYFYEALINKDYNKAISIIKNRYSIFQWWDYGHSNVFKVVGSEVIFPKNCGYSIREYNFLYLVALVSFLWIHVKDDPLLCLCLNVPDFAEIIELNLPYYNTARKGTFHCILQA